jgi:hypothetical protein
VRYREGVALEVARITLEYVSNTKIPHPVPGGVKNLSNNEQLREYSQSFICYELPFFVEQHHQRYHTERIHYSLSPATTLLIMTMMVVHPRRLCKPSSVRCGMKSVLLLILTVFCSMPTTVLGAHSDSKRIRTRLQPWGLSRSGTDTLSGTGSSTQHKHTTDASCLSVRGGGSCGALPTTEVTVFTTSVNSVDLCSEGEGYVVNMCTDAASTRGGSTDAGIYQRPFASSSDAPEATSFAQSADVDLPPWFLKLFGPRSVSLLIVPLTILKLLV